MAKHSLAAIIEAFFTQVFLSRMGIPKVQLQSDLLRMHGTEYVCRPVSPQQPCLPLAMSRFPCRYLQNCYLDLEKKDISLRLQ